MRGQKNVQFLFLIVGCFLRSTAKSLVTVNQCQWTKRFCHHAGPSTHVHHRSSLMDEYGYGEESSSTPQRLSGRVRPMRTRHQSDAATASDEQPQILPLKDPTLLSKTTFRDRADLHAATKRALIEKMKLEKMTEIQAQTFGHAISGTSIMGRARTGTGKTLAFLIPSLERLISNDKDLYITGASIGMIIIAPTRELVIQIAEEAAILMTYHSKEYTVMSMYGGTKMIRDINMLQKRLPTILVATPGRLQDHIQETNFGPRKFSAILKETKIVVLDEMDRLLDMGFSKEIRKILTYLPRADKRQTLLFSATKPRSLRHDMKEIVGADAVMVDCVNERDTSTKTNQQVEQSYIQLPSMDTYISTLVYIIQEAMTLGNYKVVVFFPTTKLVGFFADVFQVGLGIQILELHSKMSQSARQRASDAFRVGRKGVLLTSDVSARGVDYPDVSLVVQYGSADSENTYIHRLGRTGRAGKDGRGLQVLLPFEEKVVTTMKRYGIERNEKFQKSLLIADDEMKNQLESVYKRIRCGDVVLTRSAEGAYRAFLAYYISRASSLGITPIDVVSAANHLSSTAGLVDPPRLSKRIASRLELVEVAGISVSDEFL